MDNDRPIIASGSEDSIPPVSPVGSQPLSNPTPPQPLPKPSINQNSGFLTQNSNFSQFSGDIILNRQPKPKSKLPIIITVSAILVSVLVAIGSFFFFSNNQSSLDKILPKIEKYFYFIKTGKENANIDNISLSSMLDSGEYLKQANSKDQSSRKKFANTAKKLQSDFLPELKKYATKTKKSQPDKKTQSGEDFNGYLERLILSNEKNFNFMEQFLQLKNLSSSELEQEAGKSVEDKKTYLQSYYSELAKIDQILINNFIYQKIQSTDEKDNSADNIVSEHDVPLYFLINLLKKEVENAKK